MQRAWQLLERCAVTMMKWSGLFLIVVMCPLGVVTRLLGCQELNSMLAVPAGIGLVVFFLGIALYGFTGLFQWIETASHQWLHVPVEPPLTEAVFQTSHHRVKKKLQAQHVADFFADDRLNGHYAWLTNGAGGAVRVIADLEDGLHFLDVLDQEAGEGVRTIESDVARIRETFLDCLNGAPTPTGENWHPLRPRARRGLPPALHSTIILIAHLAAFAGTAVGLVYLCGAYLWSRPGTPVLLQWLGGAACFLVPVVALNFVRVLLSLIPATCPRCGSGAYWPRSTAVAFCCHRCPGVYFTDAFIRGGSE